MSQLTESLISFITRAHSLEVPEAMKQLALIGFTDAIGVMLAGEKEETVQRFSDYVRSQEGAKESRILLSDERTTASFAALLGTTAAHALDYDDYAYSNHPSAVMVPAILAEADVIDASGADMLLAYIVGYEAWAAVMKRERDHLHSKGWHPTAVFGPIGVVAAIATLRHLDKDTTRNAIGLAVAHGGGVLGNFGAMSKAFQGGRAAEAGITSIRMAMAGVTAGPDALDGNLGLLAALSPNGNVDLESDADYLGRDWYGLVHGLNVKRYPTVGASQRVIDAAIEVQSTHNIDPATVKRVIVHISEKHAAVMPFHLARDDMEAKFCLEFATVAALLKGGVGLHQLKTDFIQHSDVQEMMKKVTLDIGPDDDPVYPVGATEDWVEVYTSDGNTYISAKVHRALGHGHNPMSAEQLREKFLTCAEWTGRFTSERARQLYVQIQELDSLSSVTELRLDH
jgi:aconitate decarboxylase